MAYVLKDFPSERAQDISYNVNLLLQANLVEGKMLNKIGPPVTDFQILQLTWEGHDFLDAIRNDTIWEKTKKAFLTNGIAMTFELVKSVAMEFSSSYIKTKIGSK